jgi:hypothetical protein
VGAGKRRQRIGLNLPGLSLDRNARRRLRDRGKTDLAARRCHGGWLERSNLDGSSRGVGHEEAGWARLARATQRAEGMNHPLEERRMLDRAHRSGTKAGPGGQGDVVGAVERRQGRAFGSRRQGFGRVRTGHFDRAPPVGIESESALARLPGEYEGVEAELAALLLPLRDQGLPADASGLALAGRKDRPVAQLLPGSRTRRGGFDAGRAHALGLGLGDLGGAGGEGPSDSLGYVGQSGHEGRRVDRNPVAERAQLGGQLGRVELLVVADVLANVQRIERSEAAASTGEIEDESVGVKLWIERPREAVVEAGDQELSGRPERAARLGAGIALQGREGGQHGAAVRFEDSGVLAEERLNRDGLVGGKDVVEPSPSPVGGLAARGTNEDPRAVGTAPLGQVFEYSGLDGLVQRKTQARGEPAGPLALPGVEDEAGACSRHEGRWRAGLAQHRREAEKLRVGEHGRELGRLELEAPDFELAIVGARRLGRGLDQQRGVRLQQQLSVTLDLDGEAGKAGLLEDAVRGRGRDGFQTEE